MNLSENPNSNALDNNIQILVDLLKDTGNKITPGEFFKVDFLSLYDQGVVDSCFGNNSSNPYFSCIMSRSPKQSKDVIDFTKIPGTDKHISVHLDYSEAIVLVGKTPPPVTYFSYCTFLTTRYAQPENKAKEDFEVTPIRNKPVKCQHKIPPLEISFSCLGEPINLLKLNTPGNPDNPFDQPIVVVYTANEDLQQAIYNAAIEAGFSKDSLNTVVIPNQIAHLGVSDYSSDMFAFANRISTTDPDDPKFQEYLQNPGMQVFRVTSNLDNGKELAIPYLTPRGTGDTELDRSNSVEELRKNILAAHSDYDAIELTSYIWLDESYITIQQGLNNLGESRDTIYFATDSFTLPEGAFIVAYGANHANTGKCTYSNVVVYGDNLDNGVVSVNNKKFENSALLYYQGKGAEDLYTWKFGFYECTDDNYTQLPTRAPDLEESAYVLDPNEEIYLGFRAYLEHKTKVGPIPNELILDKAIVFIKKKS